VLLGKNADADTGKNKTKEYFPHNPQGLARKYTVNE